MQKEYNDDYNKDFDTCQKVGAAVTLGGLLIGGLGKGIAFINEVRGDKILMPASSQYHKVLEEYKQEIEEVRKTIVEVIKLKELLMCVNMKKFLKYYKRLAYEINIKESLGLSELQRFVFESSDFDNINSCINFYSTMSGSYFEGKTIEQITQLVQDGTIMNWANNAYQYYNASQIQDPTTRQISMDEAKEQSVGTIVEVSALAVQIGVSGISDAFSSGRTLDNARKRAAKYDECTEEIRIRMTKIEAIERYANIHLHLLEKFKPIVEDYVNRAVQIIKSKDNFLHIGRIKEERFEQDELGELAYTLALMGTVKTIIDSPIIGRDGNVYEGDKTGIEEATNMAEFFEKRRNEINMLE